MGLERYAWLSVGAALATIALKALAWPRRDYVGFAPAKPSLAFTAVFEKPHVG